MLFPFIKKASRSKPGNRVRYDRGSVCLGKGIRSRREGEKKELTGSYQRASWSKVFISTPMPPLS